MTYSTNIYVYRIFILYICLMRSAPMSTACTSVVNTKQPHDFVYWPNNLAGPEECVYLGDTCVSDSYIRKAIVTKFGRAFFVFFLLFVSLFLSFIFFISIWLRQFAAFWHSCWDQKATQIKLKLARETAYSV